MTYLVIYRHAAPNQYDQHMINTICIVQDQWGKEVEQWLQRSADASIPRWEKI